MDYKPIRPEEYKMKFCVVCERCQIKANNDEHVEEHVNYFAKVIKTRITKLY